MTRDEAIYIAGFLDGDGCISISRAARKKECWQSTLLFAGTNLPLMEWIRSVIGGSIWCNPANGGKPNQRDVYSLKLAGAKAAAIVEQLLPFLRLKHRQGELFLQMRDLKASHGKSGTALSQEQCDARHAILEEMHALNRRGSPGGQR